MYDIKRMNANKFSGVKYYVTMGWALFHGFTLKPGFIWGRDSKGDEFASSGWAQEYSFPDETELFIYRRDAAGEWHGAWEPAFPHWERDGFHPATEAAQIVINLIECG